MKKHIYLKDIYEVQDFVMLAGKYNFPIMVTLDNVKINAKSFLGMLSKALRKPVTVEYAVADDSFLHVIKRYERKEPNTK